MRGGDTRAGILIAITWDALSELAPGYLIALTETSVPEAYMFSENTVMHNFIKHMPTEDWPIIYGGQRSHTIGTWWVFLVNVLLAFSLLCDSQNNVFSVSEL